MKRDNEEGSAMRDGTDAILISMCRLSRLAAMVATRVCILGWRHNQALSSSNAAAGVPVHFFSFGRRLKTIELIILQSLLSYSYVISTA